MTIDAISLTMYLPKNSINNSYDTTTWERITAIKSRIFQLWSGEIPGVKICCIKFAQRVVLAQTVSINGEFKVSWWTPIPNRSHSFAH